MGWTPQRLPIILDPLPGEGLDSWIEAYARRLRACSRDLLDHLGLAGSTLTRMVTTLTTAQRDILGAGTGIAPDVLTAMTLQPLHGIAVTIDPVRRVVVHPPAWRRQTGSRFCPSCLHDSNGRWQLAWRLPWAFACPTHARLLADLCPACGKRPAPHRPGTRAEATIAGHCTVNLPNSSPGGWRAPICGYPLTDVPTLALPAGGRVMTAQQRIDHLTTTAVSTVDTGRRARIRRTLGELHSLAYKSLDALHTIPGDAPSVVHTVLSECGATVPAPRGALDSYDAHTIAVATTIATTAHQPDPTGNDVLSWIITADQQHRAPPEPGMILSPFTHASPDLTARILRVLDPHMHVRERLAYSSASNRPHRPEATDEQIRRRAASLPALLWPAWAIRLIPTSKAGHNTVSATQAALAAITLIPGTRLTTPQAIHLLGAGTTRAATSNTIAHLPDPQRTATIAILTDLAHALDATPAPIDYARRRVLFTTCRVDRAAYTTLATTHGWRPPSPLQLRILDDQLAVLLTGARPRRRVDASVSRRSTTDAWNPLTVALPPPVRDFVHHQAQWLLHHHGIDEPVTWQPPPPDETRWPGIDPDTIDPEQFIAAFTAHATARGGLRRICQATGLTGAQVRLYAHIADLPMPEPQWDALATHAGHDVLDPAGLQHLYHDRQLSMTEIARLSLSTERVVRDALTTAGTTLLSQRPRTRPVPPSWFQQHYLGTGKTLAQAAAEAGVSRNTFAKYARLHNIPTALNASAVNPFTGWPTNQQPPPDIVAACSGAHGIEYVRQILAMSVHRTRRAAAAALGLHEKVLCDHRGYVEHAAGIRIFQPNRPLTPTPEGAQFLYRAARALQRLDRTTHRNS